MVSWSVAAPTVTAAFLASLVEVVEAFTVVLAVGTLRGWRPALLGTGAGLLILAILVLAAGTLLAEVPLEALQLVIGVLLLLFGLGWLRKAILRASGHLPLHDELAVFAAESAALAAEARRHRTRLAWLAGLAACKAVLLEGAEVAFIVVAMGTGRGLLLPAALGALAAVVLVLAVGLLLRRPLARVPENALKFGVGVMLAAFGLFWTGEGLGIAWPGADLALLAFGLLVLLVALGAVALLRRRAGAVA